MTHPIMSKTQSVLATLALCSCSLIHAFVLISVYPYAALMAVNLLPNGTVDETTVGPYSGLLASSFMFGRMLSSYPWGHMADTYGRTFVLISSLSLSAIFGLLFGLSRTFTAAMIFRFLLGVTNGIVGTVKTLVSELAAPSEPLETKMMGLVVGMRSCGFLISPAIGGWLADPIRQYPSLFGATSSSCYAVLSRYPFLLPNMVGSCLCLATALLVWCCVPETLRTEQNRSLVHDAFQIVAKACRWNGRQRRTACCCCETGRLGGKGHDNQVHTEESSLLERFDDSNDAASTSFDSGKADFNHSKKTTTMTSLWRNEAARSHLIPYWIFSLAVASLDEAFPLFCIASVTAGLALAEKSIGQILSSAGLLFVFVYALVYVQTVERQGLYSSLWIGCTVGFVPVFLIPLARLTQFPLVSDLDLAVESFRTLNWGTFFLLVLIMALSKIFCCMFFTSMSIALNRTVQGEERATLNGFATLGGSIFKGLGPIIAGVLSRFCFSIGMGEFGSIALFSCIGCTGLSVLLFLIGLRPRQPK